MPDLTEWAVGAEQGSTATEQLLGLQNFQIGCLKICLNVNSVRLIFVECLDRA